MLDRGNRSKLILRNSEVGLGEGIAAGMPETNAVFGSWQIIDLPRPCVFLKLVRDCAAELRHARFRLRHWSIRQRHLSRYRLKVRRQRVAKGLGKHESDLRNAKTLTDSFVSPEKEELVAYDATSQGATKLIQPEGRLSIRRFVEIISRVQLLVAEKFKEAAVKFISA